MKDELICTTCPLGCELYVEYGREKIITIKGNRCKKGLEYAIKEVFNPQRIVTTTVCIKEAAIPLLPVKTDTSIIRDLMFDVIKESAKIIVQAPIKIGDIIIKNICDSVVNLVATRSIERTEPDKEKIKKYIRFKKKYRKRRKYLKKKRFRSVSGG